MHDTIDDQQMIARILARDRTALLAFYRRFAPRLARLIRARVTNAADAQEILQDTLYDFLEAIRDFEGKSSLTTFLFAICHHKIVDYYRKKKLKQLLFSQMPNIGELVSPLLEPEEEFDATILKEKIHAVMSRMLPRYRKILELKYIENLSVSEIAKTFALSVKGAESQLFRARKAFAELFISLQ